MLSMKHLNYFKDYISEGAYIETDGKVKLSYTDTKSNNDEVLKTASGGVSQFAGTPVRLKRPGYLGYPIFNSLGPDEYSGKVDHFGRFKYTMDLIKSGKIDDGQSALTEFLTKSFNNLGITKGFSPDYLVLTGSTSPLVNMMSDSIKQIFSNKEVKIINLPKIEYLNAGDAVDWEELNIQVQKQSLKTLDSFKNNLLHYIDKEETNEILLDFIKNADSVSELKKLISGSGRYSSPDTMVVWKPEINQEKMVPFLVRSSGRNFGGLRKFFKGKYNTHSADFLEAAISCLDSRNPKRMLIVDDNKNTGEDLRTLKANLDNIIENYESSVKDPQTRFGFYVLYTMKPGTTFSYTGPDGNRYTQYPMTQDVVNDFKQNILNKNV